MSRPLTASQVAALSREGLHRVDKGLYLQIRGGGRSWLFRYQRAGRGHWVGLGSADVIPLAKARAKALACRVMLAEGKDPLEEKRKAAAPRVAVPTFEKVAVGYIADHRAGWRNPKHAQQWENTLRAYAFPRIGKTPVDQIAVTDVAEVLKPIWVEKAETAGRLRGRIERVLNYAKAHEWRDGDNPASLEALRHILPPHGRVKKVTHHSSMPYTELPAFIAELKKRDSVSARALLFTILTAARTGEVIGATWREIGMQAAVWEISGQRMKAGKAHEVPLVPAAMEVLKALPRDSEYVFAGAKGKPLSNMAMAELLKGMRPGFTVHGFRASFKTWATEKTKFPRELVEMALAHAVGNAVEQAYQRGAALERRRELMEAWASFCLGAPREGKNKLRLKFEWVH